MAVTNEFNTGVLSREVARKQWYLATIGSESLASGFREASRIDADAKEADPADPFVAMMIQMATEEQIRQFHERLDELAEKRLRLLERIDEQLEGARAERQWLYDEALEVVFPDGMVRKVFRDGDQVRDENGNLVSPDIVSAEDVSDSPYQWEEKLTKDELLERLEAQRERVDALGDQMEDSRVQADAGKYSADDLDDKITEFEGLLAAEEQSLETSLPDAGADRSLTESGLKTDIAPAPAFGQAATGVLPDDPLLDEDFTLPDPSASTPVPG